VLARKGRSTSCARQACGSPGGNHGVIRLRPAMIGLFLPRANGVPAPRRSISPRWRCRPRPSPAC
jgi:hypothetical protein